MCKYEIFGSYSVRFRFLFLLPPAKLIAARLPFSIFDLHIAIQQLNWVKKEALRPNTLHPIKIVQGLLSLLVTPLARLGWRSPWRMAGGGVWRGWRLVASLLSISTPFSLEDRGRQLIKNTGGAVVELFIAAVVFDNPTCNERTATGRFCPSDTGCTSVNWIPPSSLPISW